MEMPGTKGMGDLMERANALHQWELSMRKGILPRPDSLAWPQEPFKSNFLQALSKLEMARFCRRYPKLLESLTRQMLSLAKVVCLCDVGGGRGISE